MKKIKSVWKYFKVFFVMEIIICALAFIYYPDKVSQAIGYRFYTVLTNSMEPTIPTYSLVLTKLIPENEPILPDSIVTFNANRFGEEIILTHYFRYTEVDDGNLYYRTQAEGVDHLDHYDTTRADILGTYVMHIPYLGKLLLFYKSKFGILVLAEYFVIFMMNITLKTRWKENDSLDKEMRLKLRKS